METIEPYIRCSNVLVDLRTQFSNFEIYSHQLNYYCSVFKELIRYSSDVANIGSIEVNVSNFNAIINAIVDGMRKCIEIHLSRNNKEINDGLSRLYSNGVNVYEKVSLLSTADDDDNNNSLTLLPCRVVCDDINVNIEHTIDMFMNVKRTCPICYDTFKTIDMSFGQCSHYLCCACFDMLADNRCPMCMMVFDFFIKYEKLGSNLLYKIVNLRYKNTSSSSISNISVDDTIIMTTTTTNYDDNNDYMTAEIQDISNNNVIDITDENYDSDVNINSYLSSSSSSSLSHVSNSQSSNETTTTTTSNFVMSDLDDDDDNWTTNPLLFNQNARSVVGEGRLRRQRRRRHPISNILRRRPVYNNRHLGTVYDRGLHTIVQSRTISRNI